MLPPDVLRMLGRVARSMGEAAAAEFEREAAEQETRCGDMIAHAASPLGSKRQCAAVRRRIERGEGGAAIIGRRHLLTPEALAEELKRASKRPRKAPKESGASELSTADELRAELRLVGGRRG